MSNEHGHRHDAALQEELAGLKAEYQRLREDKVRTEQDVANLTRQLDELCRRAEQEYGTSDPGELAALLEKKRAENEAMVADYRAHLEQIHRGLAAVEAEVDGETGAENGRGGSGQGE